MREFSFLSPAQIVFGAGKVQKLTELLPPMLPRSAGSCLVVTGKSVERASPVLSVLGDLGIESTLVSVSGEPTIEDAEAAVLRGRECDARLVLAVGGGSAIDLAKACAGLIPNAGQVLDYLEVIGGGRSLAVPALPCVALPTTSGTGSEVTKNAVLRSLERGVKVSLRHDSMIPRLALVDPELTYSVPPEVTAATGLDALTQCIEPFLSCLSNPLTDGIAQEGIMRGARALKRAVHEGSNPAARADMALCSLFGGLALANAKLGAVHGIAGAFGGMFQSPHGAVCARLLPHVLGVNLQALRARKANSPLLARFQRLAVLLTGRPDARSEDGIEWVFDLVESLGVQPLSSYGMTEKDVEQLVEKAARASSTRGNPLVLAPDELASCVLGAM